MVYRTAQKRFENRADRTKLLSAFYQNLGVLSGEPGISPRVEITQETATIAARNLLFVEGLTAGFRAEYGIDTATALQRIANAHRSQGNGGLYANEQSLLKAAIESTFVHVAAGTGGDIVRTDDRADWALGLDGIDIARAAAYALLGEKPKK